MLGGIGGKRKRGWQRMRWLDGITVLMDVSLSELQEMVMNRESWRAVIHGVEESQTRLRGWTELNWTEHLSRRTLVSAWLKKVSNKIFYIRRSCQSLLMTPFPWFVYSLLKIPYLISSWSFGYSCISWATRTQTMILTPFDETKCCCSVA